MFPFDAAKSRKLCVNMIVSAEHHADSDAESGPWRPQMATKCRIAHGCADDLAEESPGQVKDQGQAANMTLRAVL